MLHIPDTGGGPVGSTEISVLKPRYHRAFGFAGLSALAFGLLICVPRPVLAAVAGDPRDQAVATFAVNQALELERSGVTVPWSNPETGRKGVIVPDPATYAEPGKPCRAYRRTIEQAGFIAAEISGNGCRIAAAVWTAEESIVIPAVAVVSPLPPKGSTPPPEPPPPPRKAERAKTPPNPTPGETVPSLPTYTLPSKAGS